ncbi:MAG: protein-disulfide reductase DsbD [gamma proteobacterium symbiont of Bathyaustriella thionipta]|nr:protein-disulfide reductase DsbD [gamma proteobacterium symbiont of Bathyaustriella thionipta]MCU7948755.1 protein-disulfide reductase DsbD [gamma proteobacterium symbiont of Bathyaustriella thionipta]MCU7953549.1 protein-disulfide reductase DsbD [gamma proteobacterium symbiont of Bathyaustriella thionipta]MCU7955238.1 protein-disulfide reductase DsbD [gamma proteobacterium symbiont of Bathyaustriella thionipta]MCU7967026.1 protein-disulfide reductase DsbD [gamma proteobacterium symbiont of 
MLKRSILFLSLFLLSSYTFAEQDFLPPEQAFSIQPSKVVTSADGNRVIVSWKVADGYYVYRDKVTFSSDDDSLSLGEVELSPSETKDDPYFGKIEVFKKEFSASIPFTSDKKEGELLFITAKSQGCASGGICYPPLKQPVSFAQIKSQATTPTVSSTPDSSISALSNLGNDLEAQDDILDIEEAFKFSLSADENNQLSAIWSIADKHYLYKNKFKFELIEGSGFSIQQPAMPAGKAKSDEYLGDYEAYYGDLKIDIPITGSGDKTKPMAVKVTYQGCSESGICYPKVTKNIELDISKIAGNITNNTADNTMVNTQAVVNSSTSENIAPVQSEQDALAGLLSSENTLFALLTFFLIGLGLAFTPCVFPMIPILSGIIAGQGSKASSSAFVMSVVYVLSMAVVYTLVGVVAGLSGNNIQIIFQNPWVLGSFSLIFVLLALSMFGFYELQLPSSLQSKISELSNKQEGGTLIGVAIMGVLSALIVGPCMAPPLMGILLFISQTGDPLLGGSALFVMSLGMGIPLIVIGTSAGKLMPRAGIWMDAVKAVFGVAMLGVAIWMLERVLDEVIIMWLWALLIFVSGVYMGALTPIHENTTGWSRLWKALGLLFMLYASLLIIGASSGNVDYMQPLKGHAVSASSANAAPQHVAFEKIKSAADLKQKLTLAKQQNKLVMLDFYADWCTYCKTMENTTFKSAKVLSSLENFIVLQADVTAMDDKDEELLKAYQIPAPPAILFFAPESGASHATEKRNFRVVGYKNGDDFAQHVNSFSAAVN